MLYIYILYYTILYHVILYYVYILLYAVCLHPKGWHGYAGADALTWPTNATVFPALSLQLHCLAEPALLKALVQQALPIPSSGGAATASHIPSQQQGPTVRSLCQMLQAVAGVSALCQKALIFTAGPADFVQRLWTSHLKVGNLDKFGFALSTDLGALAVDGSRSASAVCIMLAFDTN